MANGLKDMAPTHIIISLLKARFAGEVPLLVAAYLPCPAVYFSVPGTDTDSDTYEWESFEPSEKEIEEY